MTQMIGRAIIACAVLTAALTGCAGQPNLDATPTSATSVVAVTTSPSLATPPSESVPVTTEPASDASEPVTPVDPANFAQDGYGITWASPSRNIYCRITEGEYSSGCQSGNVPVPDGADCVTPSFTIDQLGKGFYLNPGKVTPTCFNQGTFGGPDSKTLQYNESISSMGMTCTSRRDAMVCDAGGGHGFSMSMEASTWY